MPRGYRHCFTHLPCSLVSSLHIKWQRSIDRPTQRSSCDGNSVTRQRFLICMIPVACGHPGAGRQGTTSWRRVPHTNGVPPYNNPPQPAVSPSRRLTWRLMACGRQATQWPSADRGLDAVHPYNLTPYHGGRQRVVARRPSYWRRTEGLAPGIVIYYEWIAPTFTIDATTNKWRSLLGVDLAAGGMWSTSDPQWPPADRGLALGDGIFNMGGNGAWRHSDAARRRSPHKWYLGGGRRLAAI